MSNGALDRVLAQAEDAAENFSANRDLVPAGGTAVQTYTAPSRPSLAGMADSAGISVDEYLTVKDTGFRLGDQKGLFQKAKVRINMREIVPIFSVRATRTGVTTFIKSYDGVMTSQGQNFAQADAQLRATHDNPTPVYQTAEIPALLLEDVKDNGAKPVTIEKGTRIGITPPMTGVKFFTKFYNELREQGLEEATVEVNIVHKPQTNKAGNEWGVVEFELIGKAD